MKKIIFFITLILIAINGFSQFDTLKIGGSGVAQDEKEMIKILPRKNSVYAEFLGNGFAYSLNYERLVYNDEKLGISTRIGIAPGFLNIFTGFGLPLEANFTFLRQKGHMAEMGPGFTWFYGKTTYRNENRELVTTPFYNVCDITLRIGYKYVDPRGFLFRAAFIPTFAVVSPTEVRENNFFPFGKTFTPWAGISVGYAFKNRP